VIYAAKPESCPHHNWVSTRRSRFDSVVAVDDRDARPSRPTRLGKRYLARYFFRPQKPVSWLNPLQLAGTGVQVFLAERLGAYLDKRELQGLFPQPHFDHSVDGRDIWFDFVADTGDGFNATYAVARQLARENLPIKGHPLLPRGEFLIMGGDQVYPTPSGVAYEARLRGPYRAALPEPGPVGSTEPDASWPRVYALPGNHDWYDGLTAFFRVFAGAQSRIGRWISEQQRSYFAIRLPGNWWLFAVDAQNGAHIDEPQLSYFHSLVRDHVEDGARIILCVPEPAWAQSKTSDDAYDSIDYFLGTIISEGGQRIWLNRNGGGTPKALTVPVMISGDWHHYSRYEAVDRDGATRQLITAGGGGAYLYGTHRLPMRGTVPPELMQNPKTPPATYRLQRRFPSLLTSIWLGLGALVRVPLRNGAFVGLLGLLHVTLFYALQGRSDTSTLTPSVLLVTLAIVGLTGFFAAGLSAEKRWIRIIVLTALHSAAQIYLGVLAVKWWPRWLTMALDRLEQQPLQPWARDALVWLLTPTRDLAPYLVLYGLAAGIVAAVVVAVYLFVASLFNVNFNELFAGQRIEGYKNFLRLHVEPSGELTIHAIGLRRVRRLGPGWLRWQWRIRKRGTLTDGWFEPRGRAHRPHLIEKITIPAVTRPATPDPAVPDAAESANVEPTAATMPHESVEAGEAIARAR
jgi:hypothetical protein